MYSYQHVQGIHQMRLRWRSGMRGNGSIECHGARQRDKAVHDKKKTRQMVEKRMPGTVPSGGMAHSAAAIVTIS